MNEASKFRERWQREGKWDRYFGGVVLDIGCGADKITPEADPYDLAQGDAQTLEGVEDESYDLVFSSHTLEHMRQPREALRNWWRVVKPGGHLIVIVPDEDLYEQGYWPSIFNSDHKATFTLDKSRSWSPVTYNLLDLVAPLPSHRLISAHTIDAGYDYTRMGSGEDQTITGAEAAIEVVVQKVSQELSWRTNLRNTPICSRCGRMELIVRGTLPDSPTTLSVMCGNCGEFADVGLNAR
jgi:SAM-dependent methyltransferase